MQITKFGHCCMLLDIDGVKILTDPGSFTTAQNDLTGIDIVLITHEHQDHYHTDSMHTVTQNNPNAVIVTNSAVEAILKKDGIEAQVHVVGDGQSTDIKSVRIEGFGKDHALVYPPNMGLVENTGYMIGEKPARPDGSGRSGGFYFPGDNFFNPQKTIDVLALPVAGPWMKVADAVNFAKEAKARVAFGVHDGMIVPSFRGFVGMLLQNFVPETEYIPLQDGETKEF